MLMILLSYLEISRNKWFLVKNHVPPMVSKKTLMVGFYFYLCLCCLNLNFLFFLVFDQGFRCDVVYAPHPGSKKYIGYSDQEHKIYVSKIASLTLATLKKDL